MPGSQLLAQELGHIREALLGHTGQQEIPKGHPLEGERMQVEQEGCQPLPGLAEQPESQIVDIRLIEAAGELPGQPTEEGAFPCAHGPADQQTRRLGKGIEGIEGDGLLARGTEEQGHISRLHRGFRQATQDRKRGQSRREVPQIDPPIAVGKQGGKEGSHPGFCAVG